MKRTITGLTLVLVLVLAAIAWSQESPIGRGKTGMGMMDIGKSPQMKACMQMMGRMGMGRMDMEEMDKEEMETTNAATDLDLALSAYRGDLVVL